MLIDNGIDVNFKDEDDETALHCGLFKMELIILKINNKNLLKHHGMDMIK
jgi:hypothetical protein